MSGWIRITDYIDCSEDVQSLRKKVRDDGINDIYPDSIHSVDGTMFFIVREQEGKRLVVIGEGKIFDKFSGNVITHKGYNIKICLLSHQNCSALREVFPFTAPVSVLDNPVTIGLGDRLGLASAGHIRLIKKHDVKPVLAQQSMRELNLTGRTYTGVLDDVSWAVFQEGYTGGFGADGDHLKKPGEIQMALDCGYTMITLDCSEHINNDIPSLSKERIKEKYDSVCDCLRRDYEDRYLNKTFKLPEGYEITFTLDSLMEIVLIYQDAINFAVDIYNKYIKNYHRKVDFEVSIDETLTPTSPQAHFFVATELEKANVKAASVAPRFCGEFQKGIDYIGNLKDFEREFKVHAAIARKFGYKISVHSGSDKFSVFPVIGRETAGRYHLKTAGTNWLEAVRVIACKCPDLYREMHKYALGVLEEAKKYYHISADTSKIPDIDTLSDDELPTLMDENDSRQVIHITYGLLLQAKDSNGDYIFKDRIYKVLYDYENAYYETLESHIGKHLTKLGVK